VKYSRFELLTVGVGAAAILGTVGFSLQPRPDWIELVAQLLLLMVLMGAVHWGRKGGLVAALAAMVAYVALRIPTIMGDGGADVMELLLIRAATYGIVGVIGGEICGRIKYFFARLEDTCSIDEHSRVYNERFMRDLLANNLGSARRYGTTFSVAVVTLSPALTAELRPGRVRAIIRAVADHIRNDVRLIDDVGRMDDGRFILLMPHTPKEGAHVAADRVRVGVRDVLGAKDDSVTSTVLCSDEDTEALQALVDSLCGRDIEGVALPQTT
jgi:GGDEF domain-containing protein